MSSLSTVTDLHQAAATKVNHKRSATDAETIVATLSPQVVDIVTAAAETRTVSDPDGPGQFLLLKMHTDGGDCTMTFTSAFNTAGSTSLVFNDVNDWAFFVSIEDAAGTYAWRQIGAAGGAAAVEFADNELLTFGDGSDVTMGWDATDFDVLAAADDSVIKIGTGTNSFDLWLYGNIATAYVLWDASASVLALNGPVRPRGFNSLSDRFELKWVAGQRGKPGINADIQNATESVRMIADPDFEVLGTNGTSALSTYNVEGGITFTTDTGANDQMILVPHLDGNQSAWGTVTWGTDKETVWECLIETSGDIVDCVIWAGLKLTNTSVVATDADQVFFRFADGDDEFWHTVSSIGNSDTDTASTVTVAVSTKYHLKIVIDSARLASFYINGVLIRTTAALTTTTDLIPYIGVQSTTTDAVAINIYGQAISRIAG
jgi:hypothetical protein